MSIKYFEIVHIFSIWQVYMSGVMHPRLFSLDEAEKLSKSNPKQVDEQLKHHFSQMTVILR